MRARLQVQINACLPSKSACLLQRVDFGVGLACPLMPSLTDDLAFAHDHTTHPGIRIGGEESIRCQIEGTAHQLRISRTEHQRILWRGQRLPVWMPQRLRLIRFHSLFISFRFPFIRFRFLFANRLEPVIRA